MNSTGKTLVVYIVERDESGRRSLARLLRAAGYEAKAFASAERLLEETRVKRAACVLLDVTFPRARGRRLRERLKKNAIDSPIIAVSARDDKETRQLARELGAQFFLRKPVDDQALLDAIDWVKGS